MANTDLQKVRIVAFQDGDVWVAQCVEFDIATQAPTLEVLHRRMNAAIDAERRYTLEHNGAAFAGIDAAPDFYEAMFTSAAGNLQSEEDFRIAA